MLINVSNHPSSKWGKEQSNAAIEQFDGVLDLNFPNIPANNTHEQVMKLASEYYFKIDEGAFKETVILVQGESSFTFFLTSMLIKKGFKCVVACSERNTVEKDDGTKVVKFEFVQFRPLN